MGFKTECESNGEIWEPNRAKYETIPKTFIKQCPENDNEKFPIKEAMNKDRIAAKSKSIRTGYKKSRRFN